MLRSLVVGLLIALCATRGGAMITARQEFEPSSTATASSTETKTHTVSVGYPGFQFSPNTTEADVGDIIEFEFYPPDHSVIRANFKHGCIPYERVGTGNKGFYSGQKFLNGVANPPPTFSVRVNDTDPIFFYCGAKDSCKVQHMIGVINPNSTWTLDEHLKRVEEAAFELTPDQDWPSEQVKPSDYNTAYDNRATAYPQPTSTTSASSEGASSGSGDSGNGLSKGAIAGIAIGGAAVVVLAAALIYLCGRKGALDANRRSLQTTGSQGVATPQLADQKIGVGGMWHNGSGSPGPAPRYGPPGEQALYNHGGQTSPGLNNNGGYGPTRSPPMSPHSTGYGAYGNTMVSGITSDGGTFMSPTQNSTPPPVPPLQTGPGSVVQPAELASSNDPGNSPLPNYQQSRHFSFAQDSESTYRPTKQ